MDSICDWGNCRSERDPNMNTPLCTRHAIAAYREVADYMKAFPEWLTETLVSVDPGRVTNRAPRQAPGPTRTKDTPGLVYFAQVGELIKIGHTTNLHERMASLGADRVLLTIPGKVKDERALQYRFGEYWERGEYYRPGPKLVQFIRARRASKPSATVVSSETS